MLSTIKIFLQLSAAVKATVKRSYILHMFYFYRVVINLILIVLKLSINLSSCKIVQKLLIFKYNFKYTRTDLYFKKSKVVKAVSNLKSLTEMVKHKQDTLSYGFYWILLEHGFYWKLGFY